MGLFFILFERVFWHLRCRALRLCLGMWKKFSLFSFFVWAWRPGTLKSWLFREWGFVMPEVCFFLDRQEEADGRRIGRPNAPPYNGYVPVAVLCATRFAQTGAPDDATGTSVVPFGRRVPQTGGCHVHRVPDIADLSLGWSGFGIFDAVEVSPRNMGKVFSIFFVCLYGPGGPKPKTLLFPRMGI